MSEMPDVPVPPSTPTPELTFDKAAYVTGPTAGPGLDPSPPPSAGENAPTSAAPCGACRRPIAERYWTWRQLAVCDGCRSGLEATIVKSKSASAFAMAALKGGAAALVCGIAYAIVVGVTQVQFALATIGIAIVVATVVRKASHGVSGRRFQVLAVVLTYMAATLGNAPALVHAIKEGGKHDAAASAEVRSSDGSKSETGQAAAGDGAKATKTAHERPGVVGFVTAIAMLVGILLASPFLELTEAPIGFLIIAIGLWQAWKRSQGVPTQIDGPFEVAGPRAA